MLLTLCFYEYPAALSHINFWEENMGKSILNKIEYASGCTSFLINKNELEECVYCIPMNLIEFNNIKKDLQNFDEMKYFKTLIFGKISKEILVLIKNFISKMDK